MPVSRQEKPKSSAIAQKTTHDPRELASCNLSDLISYLSPPIAPSASARLASLLCLTPARHTFNPSSGLCLGCSLSLTAHSWISTDCLFTSSWSLLKCLLFSETVPIHTFKMRALCNTHPYFIFLHLCPPHMPLILLIYLVNCLLMKCKPHEDKEILSVQGYVLQALRLPTAWLVNKYLINE